MTDPFEARLHRALDRAARQLEVPRVPWRGPAESGRRPRFERLTLLAGVAVAAVVAAVAVTLIGHRHPISHAGTAAAGLPPAPATAFEPHLPASALQPILAAYRKVVSSDRGCRSPQGSRVVHGQPSRELSSLFSILRQPPSRDGRTRALALLEHVGGPGWSSGPEVYINQTHRARTAFGGAFYILPAENVTGQRGVPARCQAEQVTALKWQLAQTKPPLRARILRAQRRYLAYVRYLALHPEGICATWLGPSVHTLSGGENFMCGSLADFQRWGIMADNSNLLGGTPVFWTVVPDVVSSVTLRFDGRGTPQAHPETIRVFPVNNVVVTPVPHGRFGAHGEWADAFPSTIVLRSREGQIVRRFAVTPNMPTQCGFSC